MMKNKKLIIHGVEINPGEHKLVTLDLPNFYHSPIQIPVWVIHGKQSGPKVFVTAAIHGDELNGIEIIRRLRKIKILKRVKGTLFLIPLVNVYGVMTLSRYLPDRRDLNRAFPGSSKGSLAARVANTLFTEIIQFADYGIDLHTSAIHRTNLPHVRVNCKHSESLQLAHEFEAPVILHSALRDGSVRHAANDKNIPIVLYEAGEALRFDEKSIRIGVKGIVNILRCVKMLPHKEKKRKTIRSIVTTSSSWVRAPQSGIIRTIKNLGDTTEKGEVIAFIDHPLTDEEYEVYSEYSGVIIGKAQIPLVQEGDAIFHIAFYKDLEYAEDRIEYLTEDAIDKSEFSELNDEAVIE